MPDFATATGEIITVNNVPAFPTYFSNRLYAALVAALEIAHEEYGLTNDRGPGWDGSFAFHLQKNADASQPNHAGITNTI
jgi:hypothetical protein